MKKWFLLLILVLFSGFALAENIYQYDSLQTRVQINGNLQLVAAGNSPQVQDVSVDLRLFPLDDYRQQRLSLDSSGREDDKSIRYFWNDGVLGEKTFGYTTVTKMINTRQEVKVKIPFPVQNIKGYESYLQPTESIDSDNPSIIAKAAELAEGEDDLFKVSFKVASWVEENVKYDLNTLTSESSQKASWVLEHKEGVCDEMTSLFVAMMRSLGVPARFVSGISYTTSDLFEENWQPHGWAEVYFPNLGWVSFDITFGEYGYIDVTHIKLRDGFDPLESATEYQWTARDVNLTPGKLKTRVDILRTGNIIQEKIQLNQELYMEEVSPGSYNLIKGILHNTENHYAAATLQLAVPQEIEVLGRNKRTILLSPLETKETYWIIQVSDTLDPQYEYTFPTAIYSEQNTTAEGVFKAVSSARKFTQEEIEQLVIKNEEKTYSQKVSIKCEFPPEINVGEIAEAECWIKNEGNVNLNNLRYCLEEKCSTLNLLINQQYNLSMPLSGQTPGWKQIAVTAENELIEKRTVVDYAVLDAPGIDLELKAPEQVEYGQEYSISVLAQKESFSIPQHVFITLKGNGFQNTWALKELILPRELKLNIDGTRSSFSNEFTVIARWQDFRGNEFSEKRTVEIKGEGKTVSDKARMILNTIVGWFY